MSDPTYPDHREADVVLHDGSTVSLRPVRPDDGEILEELFAGLDPDSQAFRFFSGAADLARAGRMMAEVDYRSRYGLLAFRGQDHRPVGHGVYLGLDPATAEVAFAVADDFQGRGLGTILLAHLAETAGENDIATFRAEVMPTNRRMIGMFRESGFPVEIESSREGLGVEFPTSLTPDAIARFEQRDTLAARAAVDGFLRPRSVAIVGASRRRGTVGGEVLHNLIESPFDGPIYPVNPSSDSVQDVPAFASVAEIPEEIDLAVIAVRAEAVAETARECVAKGARSLVVLSAGFTEIGEEGPEREDELLAVCREAGLRLIGPNCLGILDTDPEDGLNVSFAPEEPVAGNVAFATQSGALGLALIEFAEARGIGVSTFASLGNRADITATDLLEFWEEDESTRLALLYIESFSNPGRFARVARRVGRSKPVVVVKSGRSAVGARAATSHTGALLAASDRTVDALFEQCGVIRAETLSELLDVASLLSTQPLPAGHRVGIVTNAGGPAIMCADACDAIGLEVPPLPDELQAELASFLPAEASARNPVDMIATASAEQYRQTITAVAGWDGIDALISIYIKPLLSKPEDIAAAVGRGVGGTVAGHPGPDRVHLAAGRRPRNRVAAASDLPLSGGRGAGARQGGRPRPLAPEAGVPAAHLRRPAPGRGGGDPRRGARGGSGVARHGGMRTCPRLLRDRDAEGDLRPRPGGRRRGRGGDRRPGRAEGARAGDPPQDRARRGRGGAVGSRRGRAGRDEDGPLPRRTAASSGRASSSRRWSRAASSCWSGSPPTRSSARWSPAGRAGRRSSCSATSRSASARSAAATRRRWSGRWRSRRCSRGSAASSPSTGGRWRT